jgi:hypothetical protein
MLSKLKQGLALCSSKPKKDHMIHAWRELKRVSLQLTAAGVLISVGLEFVSTRNVAVAFAVGYFLVVSAFLISARFGLRQTASPFASLFWVLTSIGWRWLWILAGLWIALVRWQLPGLALVCGVIAAQTLHLVARYRAAQAEASA